MCSPVFIEYDVRKFEVDDMTREDAIGLFQDSTLLQVENGPFERFFEIDRFVRRVSDFDVYGACAFRSHGVREIHRKADTGKYVFAFREVNPVLVTDVRPVDTEVDI